MDGGADKIRSHTGSAVEEVGAERARVGMYYSKGVVPAPFPQPGAAARLKISEKLGTNSEGSFKML